LRTLACPVLALAMMRTLVGALMHGAIVPRPVVEAQTRAVDAFSVLMTVIGTDGDRTVEPHEMCRAVTYPVEAGAMHGAVIRAHVLHGEHRAIGSVMPRPAVARTVAAHPVARTVVGAVPRSNLAIFALELAIARTHAVDASAMVGAHVLAHSLVEVLRAVGACKAGVAAANLVDRVAVAVVGATVGADFHLARLAAERGRAKALPLEARANARALPGALAHVARLAGIARLAHTRAIGTVTVDAPGARLRGTIRAQPATLALAHAVDALSTARAVRWTVLVRALLAEEAWKTVARAVVTIARPAAIRRASEKRAVIPLESRVALAEVVDAAALSVAVVGTRSDGAVRARKPVVAKACPVETLTVARTGSWASAEGTVVSSPSGRACTLKVGETIPVA